MINFSELAEQESEKPVVKKATLVPNSIRLGRIPASELFGTKKLTFEEQKELKKIEPGHKIPTASFPQIGQWCDNCDDVTAHSLNLEKNKMRCLICKKDRYLKKKKL